jgi:hypothetical protein
MKNAYTCQQGNLSGGAPPLGVVVGQYDNGSSKIGCAQVGWIDLAQGRHQCCTPLGFIKDVKCL